MDIQLFATDEELQDFPENKTDSTVLDKTPNSNSINLMASDLPRSHSDLSKISSRLPERKSKCKSRKDHRRKSRSNTRSKNPIVDQKATLAKNPIVYWQADMAKYPVVDRQPVPARKPIVDRQSTQANDQLEIKQEIQWISKPICETYLGQLVGPSEAALPGQPTLGSLAIAPPVAHQPVLRPPIVRPPVVRQPSCHVPPLLSLCLQPDLNALAQTLSPQALRYVQLSIQIGQKLLN